jgi:hypothetical protein
MHFLLIFFVAVSTGTVTCAAIAPPGCYNFEGVSSPSSSHVIREAIGPTVPMISAGSEFSTDGYLRVASSDNTTYSTSVVTNGSHVHYLVTFETGLVDSTIYQLNFSAKTGANVAVNSVRMFVYNFVYETFSFLGSVLQSEPNVTETIFSSIQLFGLGEVASNGTVVVMLKTIDPATPTDPNIIFLDYVELCVDLMPITTGSSGTTGSNVSTTTGGNVSTTTTTGAPVQGQQGDDSSSGGQEQTILIIVLALLGGLLLAFAIVFFIVRFNRT